MKTLDTRKLTLCIIAFVIAVFMLATLAFPLVTGSYTKYDANGKVEDSETETITGFSLLDSLSQSKDEDDEDDNGYSYLSYITESMVGYIPSVISCFQIILACIAIVTTVLAIFLFNKNATNAICKVTVILGIVFSLLYLLRGWAYHTSYDDTNSWTGTSTSLIIDTASHVPFIIIGLLSIAYAFCAHLVPEKEIKIRRTPKEFLTPAMIEQQKMDSLRKYKELFDNGVISQEEFIAIKRKLLG